MIFKDFFFVCQPGQSVFSKPDADLDLNLFSVGAPIVLAAGFRVLKKPSVADLQFCTQINRESGIDGLREDGLGLVQQHHRFRV